MKRLLMLLVVALYAQSASGQVNVLTYRNDNLRSGQNLSEATLTNSNVSSSTFGKVYALSVDGYVYAQPLYLSSLTIPGRGTHNVLFLATEHDSVYAFDADTTEPLWQVSFINPPAGITTEPSIDTATTDIVPEVGITSTPVIDATSGTLYVVAKTKESSGQVFRIHALDVTSGVDKVAPVVIQASVTGSGGGSSGGTLSFNPTWQFQRPGLVLSNGTVYVSFGSSGDNNTWHGWIIAYNGTNLSQTGAFCTTPNGFSGGVWASGEAPPVDASGNIYFTTGNGNFDGSTEFGDAYVKLSTSSGLSVGDFFAPFNQAALNAADLDIASAGLTLLPDSFGTTTHPHLIVGAGKDGTIYLLDRDKMGGYNGSYTNPDSQIVQEIWNAVGGTPITPNASTLPYVENNYSTAAYWQNHVYFSGINDPVKMFNMSNGLLTTTPASKSATSYQFKGAQPMISAASGSATSAILWTIENGPSNNVLHAYDATNLATELYNSDQAPGSRDQAGPAVKFVVPTIANGKVFVGSQYEVEVYGILSSNPRLAAPTFSPPAGNYPTPQSVTLSESTASSAIIYYTTDGSVPNTSSTQYTGPIPVSSATKIRAIAAASGFLISPVATGSYTIATQAGQLGFVQGNYAIPHPSATSVTVPFTGAQGPGDLNVVIVGWNDSTANILTVTDTVGNVYTTAADTIVQTGAGSQAIYYAKSIPGAATNSVTVTFDSAALSPDIRILEYSGLDAISPLDVAAGALGNSSNSDSGFVTTTNADDLIVGGNLVQTGTTSPGPGFTSRMITAPDGDIAEDKIVASTGSYNASAPVSGGQWIMQMVAFKAAGAAPSPTAPGNLTTTVGGSTQISLSWTASTESGGTISQYLIERCAGPACSNFAQITTSTSTSLTDTALSPSTSYSYRVRASDSLSRLGPYSNISTGITVAANAPTAPSSLTATPNSSTQISLGWTASTETGGTIASYLVERCAGATCSNFAQVGTSTTTTYTDTGLLGSVSYNYRVRAQDSTGTNGPYSNTSSATTAPPTFTAPSNLAATPVSSVQINLTWTAATETGGTIANYLVEHCSGSGCASFVQVAAVSGTSFNDTNLTPATSYSYRVRATDANSNLGGYSSIVRASTPVAPPTPTIASLNPTSGIIGTAVTITGTNFGGAPGTVTFATTTAIPSSWSPTSIAVPVPAGASSGNVVVTAGGIASNGVNFTVVPSLIKLVQHTSKDAGTTTSSSLAFLSSNTAANWIAVCIRAGHSGQTFTVTDSKGNTYHQAVQFNVTIDPPNGDTLGIFYAENIAAGANTITVKQSISGTMRFSILEYSGVATSNSMDGIAAVQQGTNATPNSGNLATTANGDLLLGAIMVGNTATLTAGPGYTIEELVPASPNTKMIAEDSFQATAGQISASATLGGTDSWGAGLAAFKMASAVPTPTAPSSLAATAVGPVEIDLSWTASTETGGTIGSYLIERCSGVNCGITPSNFAQVATTTSPTTTFNDTSLLGSTSYSYRVRAKDSSNNTGLYSNTASATTAAPTFTAPSALTATASGPAQVNLSWTAGTETGGTITTYLIERCSGACGSFTQVASIPSATTVFSDTGLLGSTAYTYQVRASDGTNFSGYSNTSSAMTAAPTFTAPANLTATAASNTQINLSWPAATETGGTITNYLVERCLGVNCGNTPSNFAQVATPAATTFNDTGLTPSTSYSYRVRATDAANNLGPYSVTATVTTPAATPTAPSGLTATAAGPVQINLSWTASTEAGGSIASYLIERCIGVNCGNTPSNFAQVATTTSPTTIFSDTGLLGSTSYSYRVRAKDLTGTNGPYSSTASATTTAPTFTAPSALTATASGPAQVNLSWTAGTETGGTITTYLIERCSGACGSFTQVASIPSATTVFSDTGLLGSTAYTYRVRASDGTNFGGYSNTSTATTAAPIFTAPTGLAATAASSTQINLSWTAASETGGTITNYLIERCSGAACNNFAQVATSAATTFNDTGLTPATSYTYRVRATDVANNLGPYSNIATAATSSSAPPPITFIQVNSADPQTPQSTVTLPYAAAQRVGDLNVVVVGWNDSTATVSTVTDTMGNPYALAAGPTVQTGTATQSIYYAKNIVAAGAGANSVTVKFNVAAAFPDIRILEYSGLDTTNPLDVSAGASGSSAAASSGAVTTTFANDLIIGANVVQTGTPGAGTGFTKRIITSPDSDIVEDRVVTAIGSYSATTPVSPSAPWIMQLVAFKGHP